MTPLRDGVTPVAVPAPPTGGSGRRQNERLFTTFTRFNLPDARLRPRAADYCPRNVEEQLPWLRGRWVVLTISNNEIMNYDC